MHKLRNELVCSFLQTKRFYIHMPTLKYALNFIPADFKMSYLCHSYVERLKHSCVRFVYIRPFLALPPCTRTSEFRVVYNYKHTQTIPL